ncbi:MAG: hypothetical protein A3F09_02970 [Chlamydiae bacterium RIFCSPHIGHO2_12_FULL_49_11]|nr:MAG: hypothetical protein A3F09_02970 [Chlamydiae bacterium RIFCSPHIGHO2_12_FULL_49_11]
MRPLFRALVHAKRHLYWLFFSALTLIGLTLTSQLEIFSIGLITQNTVDVFTLFGSGSSKITRDELARGFDALDPEHKGFFTDEDAMRYLKERGNTGLIQKGFLEVRSFLGEKGGAFSSSLMILVLVSLFKAFFLFFSRFFPRVLSIKVSKELREFYFSHLQKLSMSYFRNEKMGAIATRVVTDSKQIADALNALVTNYIYVPFTFVSSLLFCLFASWKLTLIFFLGLPLVVIPIAVIARKVKKVMRQLLSNQENFTSILLDFLGGIETIKLFRAEKYLEDKFAKENSAIEKWEIHTNKFDLLTRPIIHFITMLSLVGICFIGLYVLSMQLAELIVFCGFLYVLYEPVKKFADENAQVQKGVVAAERLFEVLALQPEIVSRASAQSIPLFQDKIVFDDVSFKYHDRWVLRNISLEIRKGEKVAIIGKTGSGKTTLLQLLSRLYDVTSGRILIDGIDVRDLSLESLRSLITYIPQKPFLFHDTIVGNITFGHPDGSLESVLRLSHADEFIALLPEKEHALVKEHGRNFSGGQGQRISIARALYKKAPILLCDEATSQLDTGSEKLITDALSRLPGELTQIIVTHRLSGVQHLDRFIVIEDGQVTADGTGSELFQTSPYFEKLFKTHGLKVLK